MQTVCKRRIQNEIKYIEKNLPTYIISELDNVNNVNLIYIEIITPNDNKLIFELTNDYPFKQPLSLLCNGENYRY